jgi:hypothetical protein
MRSRSSDVRRLKYEISHLQFHLSSEALPEAAQDPSTWAEGSCLSLLTSAATRNDINVRVHIRASLRRLLPRRAGRLGAEEEAGSEIGKGWRLRQGTETRVKGI